MPELSTVVPEVRSTLNLANVANTADADKPISTETQAALDLKAGVSVATNTQTGTAYTLVLADAGKVVERSNASANTVTVPPNSSVAFPVGTLIEIHQYGAGQATLVAGSGVTIRTPLTLKLNGQYSSASLRKRGTDEWVAAGDLAAS